MIAAAIFFIHFLFATIIFTKKWQDDGLSSAFLNVALILILFAVGWTITSLLAKFIMEPEGLDLYFDRDTFSLTLLTFGESVFYKKYYKEPATASDKEKQ
ncbi:MAG: hypothetical protein HKO83_07975 [Ignavibacteriaceae bacterium]|nr:hypothetical protein [Ignavibacteria bacterium]MBT8390859.1 hypothetical protein [Ignavibacteria bacterium]NNL21241.1 hypothetical protein [Ignavibacteriaceae bacterium]